jgi:hypothetical protein
LKVALNDSAKALSALLSILLILRWEPTRRAALAWAMRLVGHGRVYGRDNYGHSGAYGHSTGTDDPHDDRDWFVERPDWARRRGFAGLDRPLYPYPDRPYDQDPEVVAELDAGDGDRWWAPP